MYRLFKVSQKIEINIHQELSRKHTTMLRRENRTSWDLKFMPAANHTIPPPILHGPTLEEVVCVNNQAKVFHASSCVKQTSVMQGYIDEETGEIFDCLPAPAIK